MTTWYLDAVSPNWSAIVWGDYDSVFPLTLVSKAGVSQIIQPIFTREFKILGKEQPLNSLLSFLSTNHKNVDIRFSDRIEGVDSKVRTHQLLEFTPDFNSDYSKNAKRLIKKANKLFTFQLIKDLDPFYKLIQDSLAPKIDEFTNENISKLKKLMQSALLNKSGDCIAIYDENNRFAGAAFFFKHQNTITYLKGAAIDDAKKNGAMYGLLDFALQKYKMDYSVFDFGGSEIGNVAVFYKKFGAVNRNYYHYELNNLPFWYRCLKKIKFKK